MDGSGSSSSGGGGGGSAGRSTDRAEDPRAGKKFDPIMEEYARKILGENAEMPKDYASLVIEARRRGREGLPQPHLRPHRCDKHLQDFLDGIFLGEAMPAGRVYFSCLWAKQGNEPERYKLKGDPKTIGR